MNTLRLLKYVRSFSEGRIRIRHPALRHHHVAAVVREKLAGVDGVLSLELNTLSGSVLLLYDSARLPKERLFALGEAWATYLDAVQAGHPAQVPNSNETV